ncbi:LuxR C-terminal-related transcriptional regulator [Planobispora takensis]|uniref:LuxR family transcriptional regulator n=1 Tax=Planobispora takensis TaxID=1367882 RepID=A0A8J3WV80_9ACTN|nr:LuxR family transcriptional regulator [Planobispora takensis]GII02770.1 LuxR family transcriptional regulator [Planobispora takensis]
MRPLLGRESEIRLLDGVIGEAGRGRSAVVIIEGAAGSGKTAMLNHVVSAARRDGLRVLFASGGPRTQPGFGAVCELLGLRQPPAAPGSGRDDVFAELYEHVREITREGPLVLVVDDVHRVDELSLGWLAHLARRLSGLPLLLAVSVSVGERPASRQAYDELRSTLNHTEVHLGPLGQEEVAALLELYRGSPPSPQFATLCRRLTGGSPRFVHDLIRQLTLEGIGSDDEAAGLLPGLAPPRIARYVADRLARHSAHSLTVAKVLAVLDGDARPTLLRELCGIQDTEVADTVQGLTELGLLRAGGTISFVHPIARTVLYRCMRAEERGRHHLAAAKLLAARDADSPLMGRHLLAAGPTASPEITDLLCDVAVRLTSMGYLEQATACMQRAIQSSLSPAQRLKLTLQLGVALSGHDHRASIRHLRNASTGARTAAEHALIGQHLALATAALGDLDAAIAVLNDHIALIGGEDDALAGRLRGHRLILGTLNATEQGPPPGGPDGGTRAALAVRLAWSGRDLRGARAGAEAALAEDRLVEAGSLVTSFALLPILYADGFDVVEQHLLDAEQRAPAVQMPELAAMRSHLALRKGDVAQAEAAARTAVAAVADGLPVPMVFHHLAVLIDALLERGEHEEADDLLRQAGLPNELPLTWRHNHLLDSRGRLRIACGHLRAGAEDLLACGERLAAWGVTSPAVSEWRSHAARALAGLGEQERALSLVREQHQEAVLWTAGRALGGSLRSLALLTRGEDERVELLREAVQVLESSPATLELGRAVVDLGTALASAGQESEARDMLRRGLDLAQRCGGTALGDHAHAELVKHGARPRRRAQTGWDSLTPAESRVAELVVEGKKNREIAQLLFVSQRTVELHLTSVYRKLNVSNRAELVRAE